MALRERVEASRKNRDESSLTPAYPAGMTPISPAMSLRDWLLLAALSVLWGASFLFYKVLATELPPLTTVFGRVLIGALALTGLLAVRGIPLGVPRATWGRFAGSAALNNVIPFALFAWGETRVPSGTAAILNALTPAFTLIVTALVLRTERLSAARMFGIGLGFAGVVVLVGPAAFGGALAGQLACLAAAVTYGFGIPMARSITGLEPLRVATGQLTFSTLLSLPLMLLVDRPWTLAAPSAEGWGALLGIALLSSALAYVIYFAVLARAGATNLSLVTLMVPGQRAAVRRGRAGRADHGRRDRWDGADRVGSGGDGRAAAAAGTVICLTRLTLGAPRS